jgi:hypothetical protein
MKMNGLLIFLALAVPFFAHADQLDIVCNDFQGTSTNLQSSAFTSEILNVERPRAKATGYFSAFGGTKCHLAQDPNGSDYDLVVLMKRIGMIKRDLIPFSTVSVRVRVSGDAPALDSVDGVIISGPSTALSNEQNTIHGAISSARIDDSDDVRVLLRKVDNIRAVKAAADAEAARRAGLTQEQRDQEDAYAAQAEEDDFNAKDAENQKFHQWEIDHPWSALICEGDHGCMTGRDN